MDNTFKYKDIQELMSDFDNYILDAIKLKLETICRHSQRLLVE